MGNKWNIKIEESESPVLRGLFVSVENNGKYVGAIKGVVRSLDEALKEGKNIILMTIRQQKAKKDNVKKAKDIISKEFLLSGMYDGIYGVGTRYEGDTESGDPYISVLMNTNNKYLMQLVPEKITEPTSMITYKIKKEFSEPIVAQTKK